MLEMQVLLTNLRNGESDLLTHFNRFMRKCRKDKGLSLTKLAQITGISAVRLRSFESDFNAYFTLEDAERAEIMQKPEEQVYQLLKQQEEKQRD